MNLPGFRAEASLYQTSGRYRIAAAGIATHHGELLPQQFGLRDLVVRIETFREAWCGLRYELCESRCRPAYPPFDDVCRVGCALQYRQCVRRD